MPLGLQAFADYTPIPGAQDAPPRLYRSLRWGRNAELFVLDTRQYRDPNFAEDTGAQPKTMLGPDQLAWLKQALVESDARWKVIVSSVPMSIPTGFPPENGRDGWANFDQSTGYERELLESSGSCGPTASGTACGSRPTSTSRRRSATGRSRATTGSWSTSS